MPTNQQMRACYHADIAGWVKDEISQVESGSMRSILTTVCENLDDFVKWPMGPLLLWRGRRRKSETCTYPVAIKTKCSERKISLDQRSNGPAIAAFKLAGGERPPRSGKAHEWTIHHLYDGQFQYWFRTQTLHAVKDGNHFTQSAGLVAIHPVADALASEFQFFAWRLRAEAFRKFGYDPDKVFGSRHSDLGFADGRSCEVVYRQP